MPGNSSSPETRCSSTPQTPNGLTKAIRTRIVQIEAGNALEILRQSQQTFVSNRTTKPRTDPTADTDKPNQSTIQLVKSVVEDGDGRRAGKLVKGISGMAPPADVKRNWSKLYPEPKTQPGDTETPLPFTEEDKQSFLCQLRPTCAELPWYKRMPPWLAVLAWRLRCAQWRPSVPLLCVISCRQQRLPTSRSTQQLAWGWVA